MNYLNAKGFFKYYGAMLNETLIKMPEKQIDCCDKSHIYSIEQFEQNHTDYDVFIGAIQTKNVKTEPSATFPMFDFYTQPFASVFYRENKNGNFFDNIYVCLNDHFTNFSKYIYDNPFGLSMDKLDYTKFLSQIVEQNSSGATKEQTQLLNVIEKTALLLSAIEASKKTYEQIQKLQRIKYDTDKISLKQYMQKIKCANEQKKVYYDTKFLKTDAFINKYSQPEQTQQKVK